VSGSRSKQLRRMLREEIGFDLKRPDALSKKIYRRLKKKFNNLNKTEKSKYKIKEYV